MHENQWNIYLLTLGFQSSSHLGSLEITRVFLASSDLIPELRNRNRACDLLFDGTIAAVAGALPAAIVANARSKGLSVRSPRAGRRQADAGRGGRPMGTTSSRCIR